MSFKKYMLLVLAALVAAPAFSQSDDFGIWTGLGVEKKISARWSVEGGVDFRSSNNLENVARWGGSLGVNYKLTRFLKLGAGYVFLHDYEGQKSKVNTTKKGREDGYNVDHSFWQNKHRAYVEATGSVKTGRWKFSLRERYQYTRSVGTDVTRDRYRSKVMFDPENPMGRPTPEFSWNDEYFNVCEQGIDQKGNKDKHYLRSRVKVGYNIPKCPFNPFASYELSNDLSDGMDLDKTRLIVGTEWKITKQHVVTVGYLYQHGTDGDHDGGNHVLDLGYSFSF